MLLAIPVASAHLPHDPVSSVAAPPALDTSAPWFLVSTPNQNALFGRSDDGGRTWVLVGGEPAQEDLEAVLRLEDGTLALVGAEHVWWSTDGGVGWTATVRTSDVAAAAATATEVWMATDAGIEEWSPDGTTTVHEPGERFGFVAASEAGEVTALAEHGRVYRWEGGDAWTQRANPAAFTAVTASGAYAGADDGSLYRWDGSGAYEACASAPPVDPDHPPIVNLVEDGDRVWAATAVGAPYLSEDGCATWEDRRAPFDAQYDASGGTRSTAEAWPTLLARDETVIVGGWVGFERSEDAGRTWTEPPLVPADYTRGVAFGDDDLTVYSAAYGSAVSITRDGGVTWAAPSHGQDQANAQKVGVPYDATLPGDLWAVVGHVATRSRDFGATWELLDTPYGALVQDMAAFGSVDHLWIFPLNGADLNEGPILESTDGGATWAAPEGVGALFSGAYGRRIAPATDTDGTPMWCASAFDPVQIACQREGGPWELLYVADTTDITGPFSPAPGVLVFGDSDGVHRSIDAGLTWAVVPVTEEVGGVLALADDGTLFLSSAGSRLFRSDDDGATWVDLGIRLNAPVYDFAARPDFARRPELLIATHDGLFRLADATGAAPTAARFGAWERIDDVSELWLCSGATCGSSVVDPRAGFDSLRQLDAGTEIVAWVRGDALTLEGISDGTGVVEVLLDGAIDGLASKVVQSTVGTLWSATGLDEGWHSVALVAVEGDGVAIDAVVARGADTSLTGDETDSDTDTDTDSDSDSDTDTDVNSDDTGSPPIKDTGSTRPGCGCAATPIGDLASGLAVFALALARRRRP